MSLLREIQSDLASAGTDVTSILRKCKILAARLESEEFARWLEWELNGYPESQPMPEYRRLGANCYADFLNRAWRATRIPVLLAFVPENFREGLQQIEFREGIAKIVSFIPEGARIDRPELAIFLPGKIPPQ